MKPGFTIYDAHMTSDLFPAIAAFARVAHHGSFTRAAAELGVSPSALTQTVRMLERRLSVRLLDRNTRRVGITELGRRFLLEAQPGLAALAAAVTGIDEVRDQPSGLLRLALSNFIAKLLVLPHLSDFMDAYPQITLELACDNRFVDLIGDGFDAGIRLGESLAQDMVALPIGGPLRLATFAAPAYVKKYGAPQRPEDLQRHRCMNIRMEGSGAIYRWEYQHDGRGFDIETPNTLVSNDPDVVMAATLAGQGIACSFERGVERELAEGTLLPLLQDWWPTFPGFHLYYPNRQLLPRKLRVFIDFLQQRNAPP